MTGVRQRSLETASRVGVPGSSFVTVSTRAAIDADRAFVERVYFDTQRWIIQTLFGWRGDDIERAKFGNLYDAPNTQIIVADALDCGWLTLIRTSAGIELNAIYIIAEMQRRGVGTLLISRLIEESKWTALPLTLSTAKINPARALYERFVRLRGVYETRSNTRAFGSLADVLYRRGMFSSRYANTVMDASATTISVIFTNGAVANSVTYSFDDSDLENDVNASATYIDGFVGHLCDWHRVESPIHDSLPAGWYSPISTAPCR